MKTQTVIASLSSLILGLMAVYAAQAGDLRVLRGDAAWAEIAKMIDMKIPYDAPVAGMKYQTIRGDGYLCQISLETGAATCVELSDKNEE